MEDHKHQDSVLKQSRASEKPRLAHQDCNDAVVHRVAGEPIESANHQELRRIERRQRSAARHQKIPDTTQEHRKPKHRQTRRQENAGRQTRSDELSRCSQDSPGNISSHSARYENQDEKRPDCEEEPHSSSYFLIPTSKTPIRSDL